jgi:SH3-like domain-containing protein
MWIESGLGPDWVRVREDNGQEGWVLKAALWLAELSYRVKLSSATKSPW